MTLRPFYEVNLNLIREQSCGGLGFGSCSHRTPQSAPPPTLCPQLCLNVLLSYSKQKLMSALEEKEKHLNKLKTKVDSLLKNGHPASDKIIVRTHQWTNRNTVFTFI